MNLYVKQYLQRGMAFGGFGPVIGGIVFWVLSVTVPDFSLTGGQACLAIVSTYLLAFVQAGASVFNQIEHWPLPKSLACHFLSIYAAYTGCYLLNSWIPFEPLVLVVFTVAFAVTYAVIWITVYVWVKTVSRRFNEKLK